MLEDVSIVRIRLVFATCTPLLLRVSKPLQRGALGRVTCSDVALSLACPSALDARYNNRHRSTHPQRETPWSHSLPARARPCCPPLTPRPT